MQTLQDQNSNADNKTEVTQGGDLKSEVDNINITMKEQIFLKV